MRQLFVFQLSPMFNFLSFIFYFLEKYQVQFNQGHNEPFACKQPIPELCAKPYQLLHKLHGGATPWWSW
jgi:hypothetical protein